MGNKEWITNHLIDYDFDIAKLSTEKMYKTFLDETQSHSSMESYRKQLNKYRNAICEERLDNSSDFFPDEINEEDFIEAPKSKVITSPEQAGYETEKLMGILEKEVLEKNRPLKMEDIPIIAEKHQIPPEVFNSISNRELSKMLKNVYAIHLFDVENHKKMHKLEVEKKALLKERNYYRDEYYKNSSALEVLQDAVTLYEPLPFEPLRFNKQDYNEKAEAVALLSDWHFDEEVNPLEMNGVNGYNVKVTKRRIDNLFTQIIENSRRLGVDIINLLFLGDLVTGDLHDLPEHKSMGSVEGTIVLADYTAQHIQNLTRYFKKIKMLGLVGNHARINPKPRLKGKQKESYEFILYNLIKKDVKNIADFVLPDPYIYPHNIMGHDFLSFHGDIIKGGNGLSPIPVSVPRDVASLIGIYSGKKAKDVYVSDFTDDANSEYAGLLYEAFREQNRKFEYVNMAHFHTSNKVKSFNGAEVFMNGSLIGPNDFAVGMVKKGEEPKQFFYTVTEKDGVDFIKELKLGRG